MKHTEVMSLLALTFVLNVETQAQLVTYDFEGAVTSPTQSDGRLSASDFQRNAGNTVSFAAGNGGGDAVSGAGWTGTDSSNGKHWEFVVSADAGISLDLSNMQFDYRSTSSGPTGWEVSINGSPTATGTFLNDSTFRTVSTPLALSGMQSATIQISGFGAASSGGTLRLDNVTLDGLAVSAVPEPSTWLLFGVGLIAVARRCRRPG